MRIVGGIWSGRRLTAPEGRDTRPTSDRLREAWMSAVAPTLDNTEVLDLFAGSGALGLEALSRGARHVTFVENSPPALRALEANIESLEPPPGSVEVVRADAIRFATRLGRFGYAVAFADPPYQKGHAAHLAEIWRRTPFARLLCIEHARAEPIGAPEVVRQRRYGDTLLTFLAADDEL